MISSKRSLWKEKSADFQGIPTWWNIHQISPPNKRSCFQSHKSMKKSGRNWGERLRTYFCGLLYYDLPWFAKSWFPFIPVIRLFSEIPTTHQTKQGALRTSAALPLRLSMVGTATYRCKLHHAGGQIDLMMLQIPRGGGKDFDSLNSQPATLRRGDPNDGFFNLFERWFSKM